MADALTVALIAGSFGIAGAAVGAMGGYLLETRRSREARQERLENRQQQRDDMQRQTLLDFQEALGVYFKAIGDGLPTPAELRSGQRQVSKEVSDREFETGRRARQLAERIRDDELRLRFNRFWEAAHKSILVGRDLSLSEFLDALLESQAAVQERLGQVLRPYL